MEELHKAANAYYDTAPEDVKQRALEFFTAMDHNVDGRVSIHEFLEFMRQEGYTQMKNSSFFMELSKDGSGTLNFLEVMTLYYIVKSGRPFCEGCTIFIKGLFFTCLECFECDSTTFNLCSDCFRSGKYIHEHRQFWDNFVLLEAKRRAALKDKASSSNTKQDKSSSSNTQQDKASSSNTKQDKSSSLNAKQDKASSSNTEQDKSSSSNTKQDKSSSSNTSNALITAPTTSTSRSIVPVNNQPQNDKESLSDIKQDKSSFSTTKQDSDPITQKHMNALLLKAGFPETSGALITTLTPSTPVNNQPKNYIASSSDPTTQALRNFIEARAVFMKTSDALITALTASPSRSIVLVNNQPKKGKSMAYAQSALVALETAINIAGVASNFCTIL